MANTVDVLRAVQDQSYAAGLTQEQWNELRQDPLFHEISADVPELTAPLFARFDAKGDTARSNPSLAVTDFTVIGTKQARTHGIGIVTGAGKYTENMTMPGMVFMRTLRSKYPHARIKSIDTTKAAFVVNWGTFDPQRIRVEILTPLCELITPSVARATPGILFAALLSDLFVRVVKVIVAKLF